MFFSVSFDIFSVFSVTMVDAYGFNSFNSVVDLSVFSSSLASYTFVFTASC